MNRREFLHNAAVLAGSTAVMAGGGAAVATAAPTAEPTGQAEQKISSQEWLIPGRSLKEKVDKLASWGAQGVELGGGFDPDEAMKAIDGTPIKISAICAADGPYIVSDKAQQRKAVDNAKRILEKAGAVGSTGVIMVPAFNGAKGELEGREAHKVLVDLLKELGAHAEQHKCRMLLEPLNRKEAWFLRQLAHGASICKDVNSPGIAMMGDLYHMNFEEPSDQGAFISAGPLLHHVHLASTKRNLPGQDERSFVDGFRGLKRIGYRDFMSLECGMIGDKEVEIPKSFKFLREQWEQATV
jgi:sugar phosphate isomerase/epimerase